MPTSMVPQSLRRSKGAPTMIFVQGRMIMNVLAILLALATVTVPAFAEASAGKQDDYPKVEPPSIHALAKLREAGALALPLATGHNMIFVDFSSAGEKAGDGALDLLKPVAAQTKHYLAGIDHLDLDARALLENAQEHFFFRTNDRMEETDFGHGCS